MLVSKQTNLNLYSVYSIAEALRYDTRITEMSQFCFILCLYVVHIGFSCNFHELYLYLYICSILYCIFILYINIIVTNLALWLQDNNELNYTCRIASPTIGWYYVFTAPTHEELAWLSWVGWLVRQINFPDTGIYPSRLATSLMWHFAKPPH